MWQNDIVTLQTGVEVNTNGSIKVTWSDSTTVTCDVQYINKEKVYKQYGLTDANNWLQVFDLTQNPNWTEGNQVKFNSLQYKVRMVTPNMDKIGLSNHTFILLSRVVG